MRLGFPLASSASAVLFVFIGAVVFFHLLFLVVWKLGSRGWKIVDYIWLECPRDAHQLGRQKALAFDVLVSFGAQGISGVGDIAHHAHRYVAPAKRPYGGETASARNEPPVAVNDDRVKESYTADGRGKASHVDASG